jgi:hypothetical protein
MHSQMVQAAITTTIPNGNLNGAAPRIAPKRKLRTPETKNSPGNQACKEERPSHQRVKRLIKDTTKKQTEYEHPKPTMRQTPQARNEKQAQKSKNLRQRTSKEVENPENSLILSKESKLTDD